MRLKYAQTCLYIVIACIAFWCYKAPAFRTAGTTTYVVIAAPIFLVYAFQLLIYLEQGKVKEREKQKGDLKTQLRDTEKLLTDQLDPSLYKSLKHIVKREMKHELQQMRNDELGCTDKCRVKNKMIELDLDRNSAIVQTMTAFKWCQDCSNEETKAPCKLGCGKRLMSQCVPLMKTYGKQEETIRLLRDRLEKME
jgi:hypothetical protein